MYFPQELFRAAFVCAQDTECAALLQCFLSSMPADSGPCLDCGEPGAVPLTAERISTSVCESECVMQVTPTIPGVIEWLITTPGVIETLHCNIAGAGPNFFSTMAIVCPAPAAGSDVPSTCEGGCREVVRTWQSVCSAEIQHFVDGLHQLAQSEMDAFFNRCTSMGGGH